MTEEAMDNEETGEDITEIESLKIDDLRAARDALSNAEESAAEARREVKYRQDELKFAVDAVVKKPVDGFVDGTPMADYVADDDSWKEQPLMELGIKTANLNALIAYDTELTTVGRLSEVTSKQGFDLTDIPDIGKAAKSNIENGLAEFWVDWNDKQNKLAEANK